MASEGDLIVINPRKVGDPPREGEVLEVIEGDLRIRYRVQWKDGHESLYAPAAGAARIEPRGQNKKASSQSAGIVGAPAKKSTAKKSTAKKSTAKKSSKKR